MTGRRRQPTAHRARPGPYGFTLLELLLVMGLLSGFMLLLVQTLSSGVELFRRGEEGQVLADKAGAASRTLHRDLGMMVGPRRHPWQQIPPDARMVVVEQPLGLRTEADAIGTAQVLLASVEVPEPLERRIWREALAEVVAIQAVELGVGEEELLETIVETRLGSERVRMLLLPWPVTDDGAILELRRGLYVAASAGPEFANPIVDPARQFGGEEMLATTAPVLDGLLHFEIALQADGASVLPPPVGTSGIGAGVTTTEAPALDVWDSARAGLFLDRLGDPTAAFPLDLGPWSLDDASDDVFPHWIRVTMVVGSESTRDALLTSTVGARDATLRVTRTDDLPDPAFGPALVKLGGEWIQYTERGLTTLGGVRRGLRGTRALDHERGTALRVGREVVLYMQLGHGKDA